MRMGIIYKYTSPSGKAYIGQTYQEEFKRKNDHRYDSTYENSASYNYPFYKAIRKYGFDSFKYEVLITIEEKNLEDLRIRLNELEIYYIGKYDTYNNGYNLTIGGQLLVSSSAFKKVNQYSLNGEYITTYESLASAAKATDSAYSNIRNCCNGVVKTCKGFQWKFYVSDNPENIKPIVKKELKKVYQYSVDNVLIKIWNSALDASREGYDLSKIRKVCNGRKPYYGKKGCDKYIWSYVELDEKIINKEK